MAPAAGRGDRAVVLVAVALADTSAMAATEVMAAGAVMAAGEVPVEVRAEARVAGSHDGTATTIVIACMSTIIRAVVRTVATDRAVVPVAVPAEAT